MGVSQTVTNNRPILTVLAPHPPLPGALARLASGGKVHSVYTKLLFETPIYYQKINTLSHCSLHTSCVGDIDGNHIVHVHHYEAQVEKHGGPQADVEKLDDGHFFFDDVDVEENREGNVNE